VLFNFWVNGFRLPFNTAIRWISHLMQKNSVALGLLSSFDSKMSKKKLRAPKKQSELGRTVLKSLFWSCWPCNTKAFYFALMLQLKPKRGISLVAVQNEANWPVAVFNKTSLASLVLLQSLLSRSFLKFVLILNVVCLLPNSSKRAYSCIHA